MEAVLRAYTLHAFDEYREKILLEPEVLPTTSRATCKLTFPSVNVTKISMDAPRLPLIGTFGYGW